MNDEHRRAIDWLNEVTNSDVSFFVCRIELWKINNSLPAPKFDVIASPNDWVKFSKSIANTGNLTDTKRSHFEFWNGFKKYMEDNGTIFSMRTPRPQHWYTLAIGRSYFSMSLTTNTQTKFITCEIYIQGKNAKKAFYQLKQQSKEIGEEKLGTLDWSELPEKKDCRIKKVLSGDSKDESKWPELHEWLKEYSEKFYEVFSPKIKQLNL